MNRNDLDPNYSGSLDSLNRKPTHGKHSIRKPLKAENGGDEPPAVEENGSEDPSNPNSPAEGNNGENQDENGPEKTDIPRDDNGFIRKNFFKKKIFNQACL